FLRAALGARWQAAVVTGPMAPAADFQTLERLATEAGASLHAFVPNLSHLFDSVDALVCMGGYNTLTEAICNRVPTVYAPRTAPRSEQLSRAPAFDRLGLLRSVAPEKLNPDAWREPIYAVLALSRRQLLEQARAHLTFDGARQAASQLLALATSKSSLAQVP